MGGLLRESNGNLARSASAIGHGSGPPKFSLNSGQVTSYYIWASVNRQQALRIVLALVGFLFVAMVYPMVMFVRHEPALSMMLSLYVTLGIFLFLAIRNPSAHRSLIAFTAWSSFAHASLMGTQAVFNIVARGELIGVAVLLVIGVALIVLAPARPASGRAIDVPPVAGPVSARNV